MTLLGGTFGSDAMRAVFSDDALVRHWLAVEAALARAEARVGLIPESAAESIAAACVIERIDLDELRRGFDLVGYPIVSLVRQIDRAAGPESGGYAHWGATTQDIMDTATALQARAARRLIEDDLAQLLARLGELAREHRDTVMAGRTHGQQAVPITFGYKLAVFIAELRRHRRRLAAAAHSVELVEFAGAAGTLASIGAAGLEVQVHMARELGLGVPSISWHTSRDGLAELVSTFGLLASTLAKLAQEISLLQRNEIAELEERHAPGRGGSSTMPQKRNPIACEAIIGASLQVRRLVPVQMDAMLHDGERATGPWHAEWLVLPEVSILTHGIVGKARELLDGLVVNVDRMASNARLSGGLINSEAVMMALAPMLGRQKAHEVVYASSMRAIAAQRPFRDELLATAEVVEHLSHAEIDRLLAPESHVGLAGIFVDRVLRETEEV